jgi:hypothetical protein
MAVFDPKSRYVKPGVEPYPAVDRRGRVVQALPMPAAPFEVPLGDYVRKQGQRLDHLAHSFLADPHAFWRIAEVNGAVLPDALAELDRIVIPAPMRVSKRRG